MITRCLPCLPLLVVLTAAGAETVKLAEPGAVLPYGETREYRFTPTGAWQSVRLRLTVRMDAPSAAGSTHVMGLALNGQGIQGALSRTQLRLLNKPLDAKMAGGTEIVWVRGDQWRAVYSPDFELVASPKAGSSRILDVSPYELVIDISDLVRKGQENVLTIRHLGAGIGLRKYFQDNPTLDLVFAEMAVELSDQPPAAAAVAAGESLSADRVMWQPPAVCDAAQVVTLAADGGLTVKLPGQTLELVSRFSWQGGSHNTFGADPACRAQDGWQVAVSGGGAERTVTGSGPDYRVTRVIRWVGDHVEVSDTLENRTDDDLGLLFDNALRARPDELGEVFLGGDPDPARTVSTLYENPTLFVAGRTSGCGLLARDDVYRVKGVIYYDQGGGIRSDDFCLPRLGGATICWSLYPVLRPDYYDFINLARRDLQVNFTVPGGFDFGLTGINAMTDEALREHIAERGVRFISSGVWFDRSGGVPCYHGHHMLQAAALRQRLRDACAKLRRVAPEVKSLIYIHCFINTDPKGPELFGDARVLTDKGQIYENTGYTKSTGIPFYYFYPAEDNSYLPAMKQVVDMCLDSDQIGADGIYWDEVEMMSSRRSYDRWDGCSAELDAQHRVVRKYGHTQLLSLRGKVRLTEHIRARGGAIIGNSAPLTETMMKLGFPRFVETASGWYPARAHLYTPLSLGDHLTVKTFADLLADVRQKLMWGSLYYYYARPAHPYPTITQHMFPFTPVELHRGWLLGRERVITAVPGTFTLGDEAAVTVYWYGADGKLADGRGEERVEGGRRLVRLALAEGEMAVIERR